MNSKQIIRQKALSNKTVVITGASSGVGKAAAIALAHAGANLAICARRAAALQETADECRVAGAEVVIFTADVRIASEMEALAHRAVDSFGALDIWINNAGVLAAGVYDKIPSEVNTEVVHTNLLGYMNGAHAALPYFKKQGYGTLINNISIGGFIPLAYAGAYSASKFGLRGFTNALRAELSAWKHIHVCNLYPAFLDTPGLEHAANYTGADINMPPTLLLKPERVAAAMLRLAYRPRPFLYSDAIAPVMRGSYAIASGLIDRAAEAFMRRYFSNAKKRASKTSGNVLRPDHAGTGIHATRRRAQSAGPTIAGGLLVAGLLAGIGLWLNKGE